MSVSVSEWKRVHERLAFGTIHTHKNSHIAIGFLLFFSLIFYFLSRKHLHIMLFWLLLALIDNEFSTSTMSVLFSFWNMCGISYGKRTAPNIKIIHCTLHCIHTFTSILCTKIIFTNSKAQARCSITRDGRMMEWWKKRQRFRRSQCCCGSNL